MAQEEPGLLGSLVNTFIPTPTAPDLTTTTEDLSSIRQSFNNEDINVLQPSQPTVSQVQVPSIAQSVPDQTQESSVTQPEASQPAVSQIQIPSISQATDDQTQESSVTQPMGSQPVVSQIQIPSISQATNSQPAVSQVQSQTQASSVTQPMVSQSTASQTQVPSISQPTDNQTQASSVIQPMVTQLVMPNQASTFSQPEPTPNFGVPLDSLSLNRSRLQPTASQVQEPPSFKESSVTQPTSDIRGPFSFNPQASSLADMPTSDTLQLVPEEEDDDDLFGIQAGDVVTPPPLDIYKDDTSDGDDTSDDEDTGNQFTNTILSGALDKLSTGNVFEGNVPFIQPFDILPWWGWALVFFLLGIAFISVVYILFYHPAPKPAPAPVPSKPIPAPPQPQPVPPADPSRKLYCLIGEDQGRKVVIQVSDPSLCSRTVLLTDEEYQNSL